MATTQGVPIPLALVVAAPLSWGVIAAKPPCVTLLQLSGMRTLPRRSSDYPSSLSSLFRLFFSAFLLPPGASDVVGPLDCWRFSCFGASERRSCLCSFWGLELFSDLSWRC